jgi:glyoxalase family protein
MSIGTAGIHHVTAIASGARRNLQFYADTLGLRLVKKTVNFDDPQTYHLYFGDEVGTPGSILTFFPWEGTRRGRQGTGQAAVTSFSIPEAAFGYWVDRLVRTGVEHELPSRRFGAPVLSFRDPDGMLLELAAHPDALSRPAWEGGPVPAEHAIRGIHSVTLWADRAEPTVRVLQDVLGFRHLADEGGTSRFAAGDGGPGTLVDVRAVGGFLRGVGGAGTVHHVAFRAADDQDEATLRRQARDAGLEPTGVLDRNYFRSVYFREPGGVLFEIATDGPGFDVDEPRESLGQALKLPAQYEPARARIEAVLPPLTPAPAAAAAAEDA